MNLNHEALFTFNIGCWRQTLKRKRTYRFPLLYYTSEMLFRVFFFIHGGSKGEHALNMAKVGLLRIVLKHDNGELNIRQNL